jgi:hypothetical protein
MRVDDIREAAKLKRDYYPEEIDHALCPAKNGTRLVLKELHKDRMRSPNLIQRLARRFSVIGKDDFSIVIKNKDGTEHEVTLKDRGTWRSSSTSGLSVTGRRQNGLMITF